MRIMGLDVGDRRIGVAMSDPEGIIASPTTIITRDDDNTAIDAILRLVDKYEIKVIIVGMPYSLDGSAGLQAGKVKEFVNELSKKTSASIELRDERLSTIGAGRLLRQAGNKKAKKSPRDDAAAAFILQGYLDSRKVGDR
ncbi:MAG TPA: Holliday junction resolvase RuvX [Dehalococcoidia bacterium]|jgi:putative Holliday junction resolvase